MKPNLFCFDSPEILVCEVNVGHFFPRNPRRSVQQRRNRQYTMLLVFVGLGRCDKLTLLFCGCEQEWEFCTDVIIFVCPVISVSLLYFYFLCTLHFLYVLLLVSVASVELGANAWLWLSRHAHSCWLRAETCQANQHANSTPPPESSCARVGNSGGGSVFCCCRVSCQPKCDPELDNSFYCNLTGWQCICGGRVLKQETGISLAEFSLLRGLQKAASFL